MGTNAADVRPQLLLLFPSNKGVNICKYFATHGYAATIVTLMTDNVLLNDIEAYDPINIRLPRDAVSFLNDLSADQKKRLLGPQLILYFAKDEVLSPKVEGTGHAWRLRSSPDVEDITTTLNWILAGLLSPSAAIWVNVYAGKHDQFKHEYCPGRYTLTGFEQALQLSPRLRNMRVLNVCLTYFETRNGAGCCTNCLTRKYGPDIEIRGGGADALYRYIDELGKESNNSSIK